VCESGINIPQMRISIGQVDDAVAMTQQWLEQLHHLCDHGKKHASSVDLAQANVMLGEVRAKLDAALAGLEDAAPSPDVTVELL
jgi:hypothetical protein